MRTQNHDLEPIEPGKVQELYLKHKSTDYRESSADLYEKVMLPRINSEQERCEETLEADNAREILEHLSKFHYASIELALFALLWETVIRLGAVNSLDVGDFDPAEERIDLVHRPDQGTQLKNGVEGERPIALSSELVAILEAFLM